VSLGDTARQLAASLAAAGRQRLELAALDVEEEVLRAGFAIASMLAVTAFGIVALAALSAAIVLAVWDRAPVIALLGVALAHSGAAAFVALRLARTLRAKPPFLAATLQELANDTRSSHAREQRA
jgi:uncharacterized membrane protein YqjE